MLLYDFLDGCPHWHQIHYRSPVKLNKVIATEREDHGFDESFLPFAIDLETRSQFLAGILYLAKTLNIVSPCTADPDLVGVGFDVISILLERHEQHCEYGNATADNRELAFRKLVPHHQ